MLGRKEVDRKLGGGPSGQSTGVERVEEAVKLTGKKGEQGPGEGKKEG